MFILCEGAIQQFSGNTEGTQTQEVPERKEFFLNWRLENLDEKLAGNVNPVAAEKSRDNGECIRHRLVTQSTNIMKHERYELSWPGSIITIVVEIWGDTASWWADERQVRLGEVTSRVQTGVHDEQRRKRKEDHTNTHSNETLTLREADRKRHRSFKATV